MLQILDQEFDDVGIALPDLGRQQETPVVHRRRVRLDVVLSLAHRRHHVGPLFFQQGLLRLGRDVQRLERLGRQMSVTEEGAVEMIRMLAQVRLLGAVQLLQGGLGRRHMSRDVALDDGARLGRVLHPTDALLQRGGRRLQHGRTGGFQLAAKIFALGDEIVGRRLDDVIEIAAFLLGLLNGRRYFRVGIVDSAL